MVNHEGTHDKTEYHAGTRQEKLMEWCDLVEYRGWVVERPPESCSREIGDVCGKERDASDEVEKGRVSSMADALSS